MNIEKYEGTLEQNHRFGIKFNSHIPTRHKWYAIVNENYLGITEGEFIVYDENGIVTSLSHIPEYLKKHLKVKEA